MSSFGALIAKLQYVKHVAFLFGTPGILLRFLISMPVLEVLQIAGTFEDNIHTFSASVKNPPKKNFA